MKTTLKSILFAMLWVFMAGCSEEIPVPGIEDAAQDVTSHRIGIEDALANAEAIMADFDPATRSANRKVATISSVVTQSKTRSGASDTLLYVVNYADNSGYALLGADKRVRPVYAFSPTGQLNLNDTVSDQMLGLMINSAIKDANKRIAPPPISGDIIGIKPAYYMEYRNKRTADAGIPDVLKDLIIGDQDNLQKKTINCTPIALSLCKILSTVYTDYCINYYYGDYQIILKKSLEECFDNIVSLTHDFDSTLHDYNYDFDYRLLYGLGIYIMSRKTFHYEYTGCGCDSYWGMRCRFHTKQMFNLLSPGWDGLYDSHRSQGFMVTAKDEVGNSTPFFVVDALRYHDAYKYSKLNYTLIEGPTPEIWMHCLWSEQGNANGYFLFTENTEQLECGNSNGISDLYSLNIFGGFEQAHTSGI
ncbi:MAG: Spi family protease inhibitor [Muribaculaceae bacterium]|nr:Spi family protease inhibitor [Muribaculaceae bacterium]